MFRQYLNTDRRFRYLRTRNRNYASQPVSAPSRPIKFAPGAKLKPAFWKSPDNQRAFVAFLLNQHAAASKNLIYTLTHKDIIGHGGAGLLAQHRNSIYQAVSSLYPEHGWKPWNFKHFPQSWWRQVTIGLRSGNRAAEHALRSYLEDLAFATPSLPQPKSWRSLDDLRTAGLSEKDCLRLSKLGPLDALIQRLYSPSISAPHAKDNLLAFKAPTKNAATFWKSKANQGKYLNSLMAQLGGQLSSLYLLSVPLVHQTGGAGLLKLRRGSIFALVREGFPSHPWKPWRFRQAPKGYWKQLGERFTDNSVPLVENEVREILEFFAPRYGVSSPSELYRLPSERLATLDRRLKPLGGLKAVLKRLYPAQPSDTSVQGTLHSQVETLIPLPSSAK